MKKNPDVTTKDPADEIASLVRKLQETQQQLQDLTGGEIDAVLAPGGQSFLLQAAQEQLRESEAAQRGFALMQASILNALPAHIALIDHEGVILSINDGWRGFAESNGLQSSTCGVGKNYLEICERARGDCADGARQAAAGIRAVLAGTMREFSLEYPCHGPAEQRWFRLMVAPLGKDRPEGAAIMHINITERKRVQEEVRQSEERFRGMFDAAVAGIIIADSQGCYRRTNPAYCRMLGYTEEELREMNFASLTHPEDLNLDLELRDELLAGRRESFVMEKRYIKKGGDIFWARISVSATRADNGEVNSFIVVTEDITERRRAEAALVEMSALLETLMKSSKDFIYFKDRQSRFVLLSQSFLDHFQVGNLEDLKGKTDFDCYPEEQARGAFEDEQAIIKTGRAIIDQEEGRTLAHGQKVWVLTSKMPWRDPAGNIIGTWGISRDITERKRAEAALVEMSALLETLMKSSKDFIYFKDRQSRFVNFSQSFLDHFQLGNLEDLKGKTDFDCYPEEQARGAFEDEQAVMETGRPILDQEEGRTLAHGPKVWHLTSKMPWRDPAGNIIGTWGISRDITERKRAEAALMETSSLLETLMKNSNDFIYFKDRQSRFVRISQRFLDNTTAASLEELKGKTDFDFLPEEQAQSAFQDEQSVIETGRAVIDREERQTLSDGRTMWVLTSKMPWRDSAGKIIGTWGISKDITERKRVESELDYERDLLRTLLANTTDHIYFKDLQSRFVHFSWKMLNHFRLSHPDELKGKSDFDFFSEEHARPAFEAEQEIIRTGKPMFNLEEKETQLDGRIAWVLSSKMPRHDKEGNVIGTMGISKDITERKRTESRYHRLVDSNAQSVFFWNKNGKITGSNNAFLGLVGYTREDLEAGRIGWLGMTPKEFADRDRQALNELAATGVSTSYEKEFIRKDGSRVPVLVGSAIFEDNPDEGVCFVLDLTERKKLEAQFLRAQRMESIGTLAGGIAHDLNNILAPILMSIDVLKLTATDPQTATILETIGVSAKRGADIVRQVLSFARGVEGEKIEVQPKHLLKDLEHIIKDTFPKDIRLHFSIPAETWTLLGDPTQIHQILLNLCVNARDALPNGGNLTIAAENCVLDEQYVAMNLQSKAGRFVLISVTDTGTGIPPAVLDKIFEPFFTTKDLNKGTGLGLSTVMAIVKSHDGIINVYSEPGKGTTFKVYLPALETASEAQGKQTQSVDLPRGNGETVLIIDDEASVLAITGKTLQAFGYRVLTAANGAIAIAIYARQMSEINVVLTDMMMPIMDGPATIHALMQINPQVKIIAASGLNTNDSVLKVAGIGLKHFLTKPYTAGTLLKTLRTILDET
jgi:PAS domain S-box-containing protein